MAYRKINIASLHDKLRNLKSSYCKQLTGSALFVGGWAIHQLWLFWLAPILGALLGGYLFKYYG